MSVKLRKRRNSDGTTSLRLDIYTNGKRSIETLKHLQLAKESSALDRESNKERWKQAQGIAISRANVLSATDYNMIPDVGKKTIITTWMQSYVDGYKKKDARNMQGALNRFKDFLAENKFSGLTFGNLTALIIEDFIEYLESKSTGEGASSYYSRFKKMVKHAYRKKILSVNVLDEVERKIKGKAKKKDILTLDEITILAATPTESSEVRKAFLFCCMTGLRWIDVKQLKWNSIRMESKEISITQSKTEEDLSQKLNITALKLLDKLGDKNKLVFSLPTANGANKTVKAWVKRAGINKAITWHNARHSFGTNLIFNDVDILTASKMLGHKSMKHTHRYVGVANEMKQTAADKINFPLLTI